MTNREEALREGRRRAEILRTIDPEGPICECGAPVDGHPPLVAPPPLLARVAPPMGRPPRPNALGIKR